MVKLDRAKLKTGMKVVFKFKGVPVTGTVVKFEYHRSRESSSTMSMQVEIKDGCYIWINEKDIIRVFEKERK